jgi:hypothetical protein
VLLLKAYKEWAASQRAALADAGADWKEEQREVGESDGVRLGTVTRTKDIVTAEICDEDAALAWAIGNHPDWVIFEPERVEVIPARLRIDPKKLHDVLEASKTQREGVDPESGDELPFIRVTLQSGHLMARLSKEVRARLETGDLAALLAPAAEPVGESGEQGDDDDV